MTNTHFARSVRTAVAAIGLGLAAVGHAQQDRPCVVYSETSTPETMFSREWTGSSWPSPSAGAGLSGVIRWQRVCNSPSTSERALVCLASDNALTLSKFNGMFWEPPTAVCADAGTPSTRVFDAAYEHMSGELMVVYRKTTSTSVFYRTYTSAIPLEQSTNLGLTTAPTWMELVVRPRSDEFMLLVAAGGRLYASIWNGSAWGNAASLETSLNSSGRPFSGAYMNNSGRGIVAWSATSGAPKYRVWSGTAWGAAATLPAVSGGVTLGWMTLTGSPSATSDEVLAAMIGSNNDVNVNNWTGTAWGTNTVVESNTGSSTGRRVDIAYQPNGSRGVVAWERAGSTAPRYRTWNGSAWSAEQTGPDFGSQPQAIILEPGLDANQVVMAVRRLGPVSWDDFVAYSTGGSVNLTGIVHGLVGTGPAYTMPLPPSATAGASNVNLGNNDTRTLAPGNYHDLIVGNSCTVNFSTTGTYVFRLFKANNNYTTMNFDTSAGDIDFILTNGNFDGQNTMTFNNNGEGKVRIHVINGNFDSKNNNFGRNISLYVYNGNIIFGNDLTFNGEMYASGNITGSGVIDLSTSYVGSPGLLSVATFTDGAPGLRTDLSANIPGYWGWEVCAVAGRPPSKNMRVSRWREIGPDE
ncbi:MAG TPA: hypothetical protein VD997_16345 [Phycisphaerales bacterium]|nr:hypothetical protein [Phycisphaerales bacterium]